jgi:hypothetical protein
VIVPWVFFFFFFFYICYMVFVEWISDVREKHSEPTCSLTFKIWQRFS